MSLPQDDVEFLDTYAREQGLDARSAALHTAVRLLRAAELRAAYEDAWAEWAESDDVAAWEATSADGVTAHAPR